MNVSNLPTTSKNGVARAQALESVTVETIATSIVGYFSTGRLLIVGSPSAIGCAFSFIDQQTVRCFGLVSGTSDSSSEGNGDSNQSTAKTPAPQSTLPDNTFYTDSYSVSGHLGDYEVIVVKNDKTIDLGKTVGIESGKFDLVLDLADTQAIAAQIHPPGYMYIAPAAQSEESIQAAVEELSDLIGSFEKPKYYAYNPDICAHGNSGITACTRCIDACPTDAISSIGDTIEVNSHLCQGGGSCSTACPTGAITYAYPPSENSLEILRQILGNYRNREGQDAVAVFYDRESGAAIMENHIGTLNENIIPIEVEEVGSVGLDIYLSVLGYGAGAARILCTTSLAASVRRELSDQLSIANGLLQGLGYPSDLICAIDENQLESLSKDLDDSKQLLRIDCATFAPSGIKRTDIRLALEHLHSESAVKPREVSLPTHAPFGQIKVDQDSCTLCMGCVSVCPASALEAGGDTPKLSFIENNCVQCGLCRTACPESSISLEARYLFDTDTRMRSRTMNEDAPFHCVRCGKPFATQAMLGKMKDKLKGHHMFQNADAIARLEMCEDCRVKDMFAAEGGFPRDRL